MLHKIELTLTQLLLSTLYFTLFDFILHLILSNNLFNYFAKICIQLMKYNTVFFPSTYFLHPLHKTLTIINNLRNCVKYTSPSSSIKFILIKVNIQHNIIR